MSHFCRLLTAGQIDVHISCSRTENSCEHPLTFRCTRHSIGDGALCMDVPFPPPASFLPSFLSCSVCDVSFCCVRGVCSGAAAAGGGCHAVRCTAELQNHSTSDCDWHWEEKKNLNSCSPSPPPPEGVVVCALHSTHSIVSPLPRSREGPIRSLVAAIALARPEQ